MRSEHYIGGRWSSAGDGTFNSVLDPYNGEVVARIPHAAAAQMDQAIAAAHGARAELAALPAEERADRLERLAEAIAERHEDLAQLIRREAGKPIAYARTEVSRGITTVKLAAAEARRLKDEVIDVDYDAGKGRTAIVRRIPVGPVAAITPFNFPLNLVLHKLAPALAMGCPVVLKPAPQAPLTALALAELIDTLDLPPGSFNVVVCGNEVAERLVTDARMAMLSFTGSDKVGWKLKSISGKKKVALELGGNAAVIVDEGSDLSATAKSVAYGAYLYAGQICISTQRIYAVDAVFEAFRERLVEEVDKVVSGDPAKDDVVNGPLIDDHHFARIGTWVSEAQEAGAEVLCGGRPLDAAHRLYAPTLLTGTDPAMKVNGEEVFGPVAVLERATDLNEAIRLVNDSRYGLQAGVFTPNEAHVRQAFAELQVGGLIINGVPGFRVDSMPYGGVKDSGLGREGPRYAMHEMSEPRVLIY